LYQRGERRNRSGTGRCLVDQGIRHTGVDIDATNSNDGACRRAWRQEEVAAGIGENASVMVVDAVTICVDVDAGIADITIRHIAEYGHALINQLHGVVSGQILDRSETETGIAQIDDADGVDGTRKSEIHPVAAN